jgi:hypothetical protein
MLVATILRPITRVDGEWEDNGMRHDSAWLWPSYVTRSTRIGARAWVVCAGLAVFGCSYSPPPAMPGGQIAPPPGMEPMSLPGPQNVSRNGTYAGTAEPLDTGGGLCISTQSVGGFIVRGSSARYGQFRGTIAPDGGLQMVAGQNWIVGHFEGGTFLGQLNLVGRFGAPGCTYMLNLERTGP